MSLNGFQMPRLLEIEKDSLNETFGRFVMQPLERGFGVTVGHSLRRVLVSSIEGAAVKSVHIESVQHEFSTIKGVREDVPEIVLNLKEVALRYHGDEDRTLRIEAKGPGDVTAKDLAVDSSVEIMNPDLHIATLGKGAKFNMEFTVGKGRGYVFADDSKTPDLPIGTIQLDANFSPVLKVNYDLEHARVGRRTDYDKLTIDVWTDGSVRPEDAIAQAGRLMIDHLNLFVNVEEEPAPPEEKTVDEETKQGLIDFVRNGGGFAGTHCATDTFYKLPEYGEMIGGYFDGHPWHQKVAIKVEDRTHPASIRLGESFEITDEIYQFKQFSRERVHVLMSLDHDSFDVSRGKRKDNDYAISWTRDYGKGRVFYTALGHRVEVWRDPRFLNHFVTGVRWAMNCEDELAKPPADADILFDGNDTSAWQHVNGKPVAWTIADGAMTVKRPGGSIVTKQAFNDFRLHVEFRVPAHPAKVKGQARGNSGVYLQQRYELQILDSYGLELKPSDCGGLYRRKAADVNMCRAPGEWQSYDIWFTAARFSDGKKTAKARITAIHNGVKIHDDVEIDGKTGAGKPEGPEPMPILLQDHGNPVSFRNIWIIPG